MSESLVCLNGQIVHVEDARLSAFDPGLTHGAGLFETLRVYGGTPFRLGAHLERMTASARKLSMAVPADLHALRTDADRLLRAMELRDARMRITVTPGTAAAAAPRATADGQDATGEPPAPPCTVLITAAPLDRQHEAAVFERGLTVCVSSFRQHTGDPTAGHKTLSYLPRLIGLREAQSRQCGEALWFTPDNRLAEACMSNIFLVRDDRLLTPPIDTPVLPGVTRAAVLELAAGEGVPCVEQPLTIDDLLAASEVFLTNAVIELMPVTRIERHVVADEKPGPLTRRLSGLYRECVESDGRHKGTEARRHEG